MSAPEQCYKEIFQLFSKMRKVLSIPLQKQAHAPQTRMQPGSNAPLTVNSCNRAPIFFAPCYEMIVLQ